MLFITAANVFVCLVYLYCVVKVVKADVAARYEDPYDPKARSVTWKDVSTMWRVRAYYFWAPILAKCGCILRHPAPNTGEGYKVEKQSSVTGNENPLDSPRFSRV